MISQSLEINNLNIRIRGMPMLHSKLEVVGITFTHECSNSSPRYMRENHYAILVCNCEISYVSNSQDKHNASSNSNMSWREWLSPNAKI